MIVSLIAPHEVGGQAVLGRQDASPTPWLTERHGYDPTFGIYRPSQNQYDTKSL